MTGLTNAPENLVKVLNRYREARSARSASEVGATAGLFVLLWCATLASLCVGYWLTLMLAVPTACLLMRLFMIQHDCGHGAFFRRRAANDWVGRIIGVVTLTPYGVWRRTHAEHHAGVGNLGRRGMGDITTLTVDEYLSLSLPGRLGYRIYRHPVVMFGLIPAYLFLLHNRVPRGLMATGWQPWLSAMGTNAAIAGVVAFMGWLVGFGPFFLVQTPVVLIAATLAVWFFYVQHQFEGTRWAGAETWRFHDAALNGSSHYALPPALAWFTGNIGVHHVHHLCSRIPSYRLGEVLHDHPELATIGRVTLLQSLRCVSLALWDEGSERLISFRALRTRNSLPRLSQILVRG